MKTVHWLFTLSVALFLTGIAFVIAGARAARRAPVVVAAPAVVPIASVKQIMKGIVGPAANVVFSAVSTTTTARGVEEKAPQTPEEWEAVGNSAAALIESGNLILMGNRAIDQGDWAKFSRQMIEAGKVALKATQDKSADGVLASGEAINASCDDCHLKYERK